MAESRGLKKKTTENGRQDAGYFSCCPVIANLVRVSCAAKLRVLDPIPELDGIEPAGWLFMEKEIKKGLSKKRGYIER